LARLAAKNVLRRLLVSLVALVASAALANATTYAVGSFPVPSQASQNAEAGTLLEMSQMLNLATLSTAFKTQPIFGSWPGLSAQAAAVEENTRAIADSTQAIVPTLIGSGTALTFAAPAQYVICTTTCTITPPVPAAGYQFCAMNDDNVSTVITLGAIGSSSYYEKTARTGYGTAGTGTIHSGGAAGDMICIVGRDSTHYLTTTYVGTWTTT
jgi:hypothetical protein